MIRRNNHLECKKIDRFEINTFLLYSAMLLLVLRHANMMSKATFRILKESFKLASGILNNIQP